MTMPNTMQRARVAKAKAAGGMRGFALMSQSLKKQAALPTPVADAFLDRFHLPSAFTRKTGK